MKIREYIQVKPMSSENPDPATYCPAYGYILNPDLPTPPSFVIPPNETDEKIVMIVSSEQDNAVSFTCTISNTGQFKTQVYDMAGTLKYTVNTNNNATLNLDLLTSYGTLVAEGYYLYKIVITATIVTNVITRIVFVSRTGYGAYGWPVKEIHFYAPNLTTLSALAAAMLKMVTYVKFYANCNSLTNMQATFASCFLLKEIILPPQMNLLTTAASCFAYSSALRYITWPTSLPAITAMNSCFTYGGLKKCTPTDNPLPASMPLLSTINSMFELNDVIEEIEIPNNLPALASMNNMFIWCKKLKTVKFTGIVGEPIAGASFDWVYGYNPSLTRFTYPPTFYCRGGGQATQGKSCTELTKIVLPTTLYYYITTNTNFSMFGRFDENVKLTEISQVTAGGNAVCSFLFFSSVRTLQTFWQPLLRVFAVTLNCNSTNKGIMSSFEINWAEIQNSASLPGSNIALTFPYNQFQVAEINRIFAALPVITVAGTIDFRNNPGYAACNKLLATAKGWTVS